MHLTGMASKAAVNSSGGSPRPAHASGRGFAHLQRKSSAALPGMQDASVDALRRPLSAGRRHRG